MTALPELTTIEPAVADMSVAGSANPLSSEHLQALELAQQRGRKIRRAVKVALFDAWSTAVIAGGAVLFSIFDPSSLIIGIGLALIAWNEFKGAGQLKQLKSGAPRRLMLNQIALGVMIILYSIWSIHHTLTAPSAYAAYNGQVGEMLEPVENLGKLIACCVYFSLMFFALFVQGGTAWFFASRKRHIRNYLAQTPQWILQIQRVAPPHT